MAQDQRDLYSILKVNRDADPEIIEAAFKALAEKYRLGPESSSDAAERMQDMQAAYAVLADANLRSLYDRLLDGGAASINGHASLADAETARVRASAAGDGEPLACQDCGYAGAGLRYVTYAWSAGSPLHPSSRVSTLLLCSAHRRRRGLAYATLAAVTGLWTGPRRPAAPVRDAARDLRGGILPTYSNARLQRRLALDYLAKEDLPSAVVCLRQSLEFQRNEAVEHLLERLTPLVAAAPAPPPERRRTARRSLRPMLGMVVVVLMLLLAAGAMVGILAATNPVSPATRPGASDPLRDSPLPKVVVEAQPNDTPFRTEAYYLALVRLLDRLAVAADQYSAQVKGIDTFAEAQDSPVFVRASRAFGDQLMGLVDDLTALGAPPPELAEFHRLTEELLVLRAAIAFDFTIAARSGDAGRWQDAVGRQQEFNRVLERWQQASTALSGQTGHPGSQ